MLYRFFTVQGYQISIIQIDRYMNREHSTYAPQIVHPNSKGVIKHIRTRVAYLRDDLTRHRWRPVTILTKNRHLVALFYISSFKFR